MASARGAQSPNVRNSPLSPAKIKTLEGQGGTPTTVTFNVIAREGGLVDHTRANYYVRDLENSIRRWVRNSASQGTSGPFKGELTTGFHNVDPKHLSFELVLRADVDYTSAQIRDDIARLQSLCYPRFAYFGNPPLCILLVLNLYSLFCYVTEVSVIWMNLWDLKAGLPVGANVTMSVLMQQYPIREHILPKTDGGKLASFYSIQNGGYTGRLDGAGGG